MPVGLCGHFGGFELLRLTSERLPWALAATQLVSWGSIYYSFSLFLLPMEQELGWSRQNLLNALSLGLLTAGACAPLVGAHIDRWGGRRLMAGGSFLAAVLLLLWAWAPSLGSFYAIWVGLGIAQAMTLYEPAFAVLNRELGSESNRAVVKVTLVAGFASTVFIPLTQALVASLGWRHALYILAGFNIFLCLPLHGALPARAIPPRSKALGGARSVLATIAFWGLLMNSVANGLVFSIVTFHGLPLFVEHGMSAGAAVGVMALIGPAQVLGRIFMLAPIRHLTPTRVGRIAGFLLPLGLVAFLSLPDAIAGGVFLAVCYGASNGITTILRSTATAELLGRQNFGVVTGMIATPTSAARALAPAAAALLWTHSSSYGPVLYGLLGSSLVGAIAFWVASASPVVAELASTPS